MKWILKICVSIAVKYICLVCASVRGDNTRALASGLSPVHTHKPYHNFIITPACIFTCVQFEILDVK